MSNVPDNLSALAEELVSTDTALQQVADDEEARLMVADVLQQALEEKIGGTSFAEIQSSKVPMMSGLSSSEIYGLAHSDRSVPLLVNHVARALNSMGFALHMIVQPLHV